MALTGVNIGNVGLLYPKFEKVIVRTLNDEAKAFKMAKRDMNWTGDFIQGTLHTARSTAMGFTEDGGRFPNADKQDYLSYKIGRRFYQNKIKITDGAMAAAKGGENVAKDVIQSEIRGMMNDVLKYFNLFFFRDGTGVCATLKGTAVTGSSNIDVDDSRLLWPGGTFQLYDTTLATNRGDIIVSNVDQALDANGNATFDPSASITSLSAVSGDKMVWDGSLNRAFSGLSSLINDSATTFQNVNVATTPRYSSMVLDNSGTNRALTPHLLRVMLAGIKQKAGSEAGGGLKVFADNWVGVEFEEMYEGELRLTPSDTTQGYASTTFQSALGPIEFIPDADCKRHTIFALDPSQLYHAVQKDLGFRLENGEIFKRSDDAAYWTATMLSISQMYIEERNTSGRINDISDSATHAY